MNELNIKNISYSSEIIKSIIGITLHDIPEIINLNSLKGSRNPFFKKCLCLPEIKINLLDDNSLCLDIYLSLKYGVNFKETINKARTNIAKQLLIQTSLKVKCINIYVQSII